MVRIRRCWSPVPSRPMVDNGYERQFTYVYGAVSPIEGELDWKISPQMNTEQMNQFLKQVSHTNLPSTIEYSSSLLEDPREGGHGAKFLWRFVQMVQTRLDCIHDLVQGVEDLIAYIVLANVLQDVFGGV